MNARTQLAFLLGDRMPTRAQHEDEFAELLAEDRVRCIEWAHPALAALSDAARLIYASLVDGTSDAARETLRGVDLVWRNRAEYRDAATTTNTRRGVLDSICRAVEELTSAGLLLLLDESTICGGWVRKPWEGQPS